MRHVLSVLSKEKVQSNCTKCAIPVMAIGLKAVQILITDREKAKRAFQETGENLVQIAKERHCSKLEYVCAVVEAMERNLASMQTHQKSVKNVVRTTTPLKLVAKDGKEESGTSSRSRRRGKKRSRSKAVSRNNTPSQESQEPSEESN